MDTTSNILVPLFFLQVVVGAGLLAWWFLQQKSQVLRDFGLGLIGYTLGFGVWTYVVVAKPDDLAPWILLGVVPFLLAHLAYAKAAQAKVAFKNFNLIAVTFVLLAATFIARTFFYPAEPYFSKEGLLFFDLQPLPVALYIATISASFLPAIRAVVSEVKNKALKPVMSVCFTVLYVNAIILVSAKDDTLLLINGVVLSVALLVLWVKTLTTPVRKGR